MINFDSPCISVCALDENGKYCIGCKRTKEEIGGWMRFPEVERKRLIKEVKTRKFDEEGNIRNKRS